MSLAIFDLDNTLLAGDSDYLWGQFLVEAGAVERDLYEKINAGFYAQYREGTLDITKFLAFALKPLADHEPSKLYRWREQFIEEKIKPILLPAAAALIRRHQHAGDTALVITATNRFVTEPIVQLYGIDHLIATAPEFKNGRFTGRFTGIPCFQEGKLKRLHDWLSLNQCDLDDSSFYSDSHNDLPLLCRVDRPVAVDPDETLRRFAEEKGWPIISLRADSEKSPKHNSHDFAP